MVMPMMFHAPVLSNLLSSTDLKIILTIEIVGLVLMVIALGSAFWNMIRKP